jgi:hypothetical protein
MDPLEIAIAIKVLGELSENPDMERYMGPKEREGVECTLELLKSLNSAMGVMPVPGFS